MAAMTNGFRIGWVLALHLYQFNLIRYGDEDYNKHRTVALRLNSPLPTSPPKPLDSPVQLQIPALRACTSIICNRSIPGWVPIIPRIEDKVEEEAECNANTVGGGGVHLVDCRGMNISLPTARVPCRPRPDWLCHARMVLELGIGITVLDFQFPSPPPPFSGSFYMPRGSSACVVLSYGIAPGLQAITARCTPLVLVN